MSIFTPTVDRIRIIPRQDDFLDRLVGDKGDIFYNSVTGSLRIYNGTTKGGNELAKTDLTNISNSVFAAKATAAGVGSGGGGASVDVSDTAPSTPTQGNIWLNSNTGKLYVYVTDTDSSQWVQPSVPIPNITVNNAFSSIALGDSTQFSANDEDTLVLLDGPGIEISADPASNSITISALATGSGASDYSELTGLPDQDLNTTDDVVFNSVSAGSFTNTGVGAPSITSASSITFTAADAVIISGAPLRLPSFTTTARGSLSPGNGDVIYNTTDNKVQVYQNGAWINLDDGTSA